MQPHPRTPLRARHVSTPATAPAASYNASASSLPATPVPGQSSLLRSPLGSVDSKGRMRVSTGSVAAFETPGSRRGQAMTSTPFSMSRLPNLHFNSSPVSDVSSSLPATPPSAPKTVPRRRTRSTFISHAHSRSDEVENERPASPPSFDQLAYEEDPILLQKAAQQFTAKGGLEEFLLASKATTTEPRNRRRVLSDASRLLRGGSIDEEDDLLAPISPPPATEISATPPRKVLPTFFFTPPPPARKLSIVPAAPPASAQAGSRVRTQRPLSPFSEKEDESNATTAATSAKAATPLRPGPLARLNNKPRLSGLSPAFRATTPSRPSLQQRSVSQPLPLSFTVEAGLACLCCEDAVTEAGVRIGPCDCFVCKRCFTSGMNIVSDIVGGTMRCPACTTPVVSFSPETPPKNTAGKKFLPNHALRPRISSAPPIEDDTGFVVLRFDNASWDVMPDMVATFLPEGTLPEPTQNPHPVHLLIDPYEGKTKDYFFIEVTSKKAAAAVIKTCQNQLLGTGKRARRVTITISTPAELQREVQPSDIRMLTSLVDLCSASVYGSAVRKSYVKQRAYPFLYLLTILTKADLAGMENAVLIAFQGAAALLSSLLDGPTPAAPTDRALASLLYSVLAHPSCTLLAPVLGAPSVPNSPFLSVVPGVGHPASLPLLQQLLVGEHHRQQQAQARMRSVSSPFAGHGHGVSAAAVAAAGGIVATAMKGAARRVSAASVTPSPASRKPVGGTPRASHSDAFDGAASPLRV